MNNNLEYYLNLNYSIEIKEIPESEGGGFIARLPQFGELGIVGDGETILEALEELEEYKKLVFEEYLTNGKTLPEPEDDSLENRTRIKVSHWCICRSNESGVSSKRLLKF